MDAIMFKVTTAPKSATKVPADTSVFVPVLPEAVPMFAQVLKPAFLEDATTGLRRKSCFKVPDVVVAPQQATGGSQRVQISQVSDLHSSVIMRSLSLLYIQWDLSFRRQWWRALMYCLVCGMCVKSLTKARHATLCANWSDWTPAPPPDILEYQHSKLRLL